jgi:hypothetical protein
MARAKNILSSQHTEVTHRTDTTWDSPDELIIRQLQRGQRHGVPNLFGNCTSE